MQRFQVLWHSVDYDGAAEVVETFESMIRRVVHPVEPRWTMRYECTRTGSGYDLLEEGDLVGRFADVEETVDAMHMRVHRRAFEAASLLGWVRVHAATVDISGRRILLVGPSGSGKTTLALALLLAQAAGDPVSVQGDESVLLRHGVSFAVPRPLHVKPGAVRLFPTLAPLLESSPRTGEVALVNPERIVNDPRVTLASVDEVVLLERSDAPSSIDDISLGRTMETLIDECFVVTESRSALVREFAETLRRATSRRLHVGPLRSAVRSMLADAPSEDLRGPINTSSDRERIGGHER